MWAMSWLANLELWMRGWRGVVTPLTVVLTSACGVKNIKWTSWRLYYPDLHCNSVVKEQLKGKVDELLQKVGGTSACLMRSRLHKQTLPYYFHNAHNYLLYLWFYCIITFRSLVAFLRLHFQLCSLIAWGSGWEQLLFITIDQSVCLNRPL